VIRVEDLRKRYHGAGREVLSGLDLEIGEGEFVSLVGRSGCGKTTLLNIIGGLDRAYRGTVEVGGTRLGSLPDAELARYRLRTVGIVFQAYHLLDHLSCAENVSLAARFDRGGSWASVAAERDRAREVLDLVGLSRATGLLPNRLSGGERQRVAIARALFNRPRIVLLDEPTGNLDTATGGEMLDLLVELHSELGLTVIAATHDSIIEAAGGRVLTMADGVVKAAEGAAT
jgi:ABC-type lipoprotein export system ATPase subunit